METLHIRPIVGRIQTDYFGVLGFRFREKIFVRGYKVGDPHVGLESIAPRPQHMSLQVHRILVVRCDGKDVNFIAVLDGNRL